MNKAEEILAQLDECNSESTFPMLDNGYIYPAGTKLTAYRDDIRWIIVIEIIGFNYRGGGHNGISNCLHVYGNCLDYKPGTRNENFITITDDAYNCNTFDEEEFFFLNPDCTNFILRGKTTQLYKERELYDYYGISIEDQNRINAFEFLRLLDALHHDELVATEIELRERIPYDIPKILELHDWCHPDILNDELPSKNETFIQIAKVLQTGDVAHYKPSNAPNTNWKYWPEGGTL
jgi:hypothetical protein